MRNPTKGGRSPLPATFSCSSLVLSGLCVSALILSSGCSTTESKPRLRRFQYTNPHMGTTFNITLYATSRPVAEQATQSAFNRIAELEDILSDYMADSELRQLTQYPVGQPIVVSDDFFKVLQRSAEISAKTDGAFDLTAGPYTQLWRFSRKRGTLPTESDLTAARALVGWMNVVLNTNTRTATLTIADMRLDAGGIAKGYAADEAMRVLKAHGVDRALVAAGGDILTSLPPPGEEGWTVTIAGTGTGDPGPHVSGWVSSGGGGGTGRDSRHSGSSVGLSFVGVAEPIGSGQPPQTLSVRNAAISTSGNAEQFIKIDGVYYSHIVSPFTGLGLTNRIQATVIAPNATTSDALATACCILGPDRAVQLVDSIPSTSAILVVKDGDQPRIWRSRGAP